MPTATLPVSKRHVQAAVLMQLEQEMTPCQSCKLGNSQLMQAHDAFFCTVCWISPAAVACRGGTTMEAMCKQIHNTLTKEFKYALVWGCSAKHYPQRVGLTHQLADEDVVQVSQLLQVA
eukprot:GHRR01015316.1.p2 GENE.GHRR01015316.1~~GHRR01015316.1.p2  ORF type:complete len:119 (-),score=39.97 GHRR01015316.1:1147-1503(-)